MSSHIDPPTIYYSEDQVVIDEAGGETWERLRCEAMVRRSVGRYRPCRRAPEFWRLGKMVCFVHMRTEEVAFRAE